MGKLMNNSCKTDETIIKRANMELHKLEVQFYEQVRFEIFNEGKQKYIVETLCKLWKQLKKVSKYVWILSVELETLQKGTLFQSSSRA